MPSIEYRIRWRRPNWAADRWSFRTFQRYPHAERHRARLRTGGTSGGQTHHPLPADCVELQHRITGDWHDGVPAAAPHARITLVHAVRFTGAELLQRLDPDALVVHVRGDLDDFFAVHELVELTELTGRHIIALAHTTARTHRTGSALEAAAETVYVLNRTTNPATYRLRCVKQKNGEAADITLTTTKTGAAA